MLYFDRIDISEGIHVNKTSASKGCIICPYQYFLDKMFKFQPDVCHGCHDVLMSMNLNAVLLMILVFQTFMALIIVVILMELAKEKP